MSVAQIKADLDGVYDEGYGEGYANGYDEGRLVMTPMSGDSKRALPKPKPKLKLKLGAFAVTRESLGHAGASREACNLCKRACGVGDYRRPSVPEEYSGQLAVVVNGWESGREKGLLRRLWRKAGWEDADVALVPALRCGSVDSPSMAQLRCCRPFLLQALHVLKPRHILAVGATAMRALRNSGSTNITKARGRMITIPYA